MLAIADVPEQALLADLSAVAHAELSHHRVSIAIATGAKTIDAYVTEVLTAVPARGIRSRADLLTKSYERLVGARVPLTAPAYAKISFTDPWSYAELGEAVEAWGFRCMQEEHRFLDRRQIAQRWSAEEYTPVVQMLRAADLIGPGTEAEAYQRVARERYRLIRMHERSDEVIERLRNQIRYRPHRHRWRPTDQRRSRRRPPGRR